jgi:Zn-dependent membrane protease YugP
MLIFFILIGVTMLISLAAQAHVKSTYNRYSQVGASSGATGAQVADAILRQAGIQDVEISEINETLGDHYDPSNRRLVLSSQNFHGRSLAALGVAAHECGHAIQHKIAYAPLTWRMASIGAVNFVNPMLTFLPLVAMLGLIPGRLAMLCMAVGMGVIMMFNLVTLPVEFDASNRAKAILQGMGFIGTPEEMHGVRKTLDAAGWTYVAAFIVSLIYFLYYLLPLLMGGRDRE